MKHENTRAKVSQILACLRLEQVKHVLMDVNDELCTIKIDTFQSCHAKKCVENIEFKCGVSKLETESDSILVVDLKQDA